MFSDGSRKDGGGAASSRATCHEGAVSSCKLPGHFGKNVSSYLPLSVILSALQPPVEDVDLRRPRDMDYRNVISKSVASSSVDGTSFVSPRVTRTRKSVLPDTATIRP